MGKLLNLENVSILFIENMQWLNQRDLKVITDLTLDVSEDEILLRIWKKFTCTCNDKIY